MWQREQKASSSEPGRERVYFRVPRSKVELHSPWLAKGLWVAFSVPSGGCGVSHSPLAEVTRESSRNAARHAGSRHELDIMEPFHSSKIFWWQVLHCPGLSSCSQCSWYGGGNACASASTYGAASGIRLGMSLCLAASGCR